MTRRTPPQRVAITAASARLPVRTDITRHGAAGEQGWEAEAWTFFDEVPEVKFAARFLGNALSRLRLFPAVIVSDDDPPMSLDDAAKDNDSPVTAELAAAAAEEWARLDAGDEGMAGLQREFGINLSMVGDSHLVGREVDGFEQWQVYSNSALVKDNDRLAIKETPNGAAVRLADDDFVARIWRRHARWPGLADSNMRAVLDVCEELGIYGRQFRAVGRSRNNAGLLLLPSELDFANQPTDTGDDPPAPTVEMDPYTPFERQIVTSMVTPTADDGSASQVVPHMVRGSIEALAAVRHIPLDRKIDENAVERIVHLISRLANGLDVPVEVLTGVADANHWSAWQIEDSTYKAHVEPLAQIPASGMAAVFLRPALLARGFDATLVRSIMVAIDPSDLVVRPNRGADAKDAHDRDALSDEALRSYLGFSEADAPDEEELLRRYVMTHGVGSPELTEAMLEASGYDLDIETPEPAPAGPSPFGPPDEETPAEEGGQPMPAEPVMASGAPLPFGDRLAAIDMRLQDRVQIAASELLSSVLARAGSRLRTKAQGDESLRAKVKGLTNAELVALAAASDLAPAEDLISETDFDPLGTRFRSWAKSARREALAVVGTEALSHGVTATEFKTFKAEEFATAAEDDKAGWVILSAALVDLGRARIFDPSPVQEEGEFDETLAVPPGPVRAALARAGGAVGAAGPPTEVIVAAGATMGAATGGVASGPTMIRFVKRTGAVLQGWRWEVGAPTVPFPPHHALNGQTFTDWNDPRLDASAYVPKDMVASELAAPGTTRPSDFLTRQDFTDPTTTRSREVTRAEFADLRTEGEQRLAAIRSERVNLSGGIDDPEAWADVKASSWKATRDEWGGQTISAETALPFTGNSGYAMTVKNPGQASVTVPIGATQAQLDTALDTARTEFGDQLSYHQHYLGVFRNDDIGLIEIDPVLVVNNLSDVETIGSYTRAVGGAYNFADELGYWPPHVGA